MKANKPVKKYEPIKAGTYAARCVHLVDLGTHKEEYKDGPRMVRKLRLSFELPNNLKVFKEGEPAKPLMMSREFSLSMNEKANLRKFVEGMIGTALHDEEAYNFELSDLVGMTCMIGVSVKKGQNGDYSAISSVSPVMEGVKVNDQVNPSLVFELDSFDQAKFDSLPDFIKEKVTSSAEWKARLTPEKAAELAEIKESYRQAQEESKAVDEAFDAISGVPFP